MYYIQTPHTSTSDKLKKRTRKFHPTRRVAKGLYTDGLAAPGFRKTCFCVQVMVFTVSVNTFALLDWFRNCAIPVLHLFSRNALSCANSRNLHQGCSSDVPVHLSFLPNPWSKSRGATTVIFALPVIFALGGEKKKKRGHSTQDFQVEKRILRG